MKQLLNRDGVPRDPDHRCLVQEEEERMTPMFLPFLRPGLMHASTFCRMLCGARVFFRI